MPRHYRQQIPAVAAASVESTTMAINSKSYRRYQSHKTTASYYASATRMKCQQIPFEHCDVPRSAHRTPSIAHAKVSAYIGSSQIRKSPSE
mmetsp:Transcript_17678/g.42582  ORF Transcript_17678/g.42582 Transcript_17678/m.42582 type:complete len:91 (+) Transcript_17678:270-542(+)